MLFMKLLYTSHITQGMWSCAYVDTTAMLIFRESNSTLSLSCDIVLLIYNTRVHTVYWDYVVVIYITIHRTNVQKFSCIGFLFQCCEKNKLQRIYKDDKTTWPFVFYLTTTKDKIRRFESAAYSGWFIHTKPSGIVCVDQGSNNSESNFYVVIYLGRE